MQGCVALLYLLLGLLIHRLIISNGIVSIVWPGSGLALAALLLGGRRMIIGVLLGALLLNVVSNDSFWAMAGITLANVAEAVLGWWLFSRFGQGYQSGFTLRRYLYLIALGGGLASVVGGLMGALALLLAGVIAPGQYLGNAVHWWMGDTLGVVLLTPMLLVWAMPNTERLSSVQRLEGVLLTASTFFAGQLVFLGWLHQYLSDTPRAT